MIDILTDKNFLGAFFQTTIIIFLGYIFRKRNYIDENGKSTITTIVWKLGVPCMAFNAFMIDIDFPELMSGLLTLFFSLVFYIVFLCCGKFSFQKLNKKKTNVCALMMTIGQVTLFSMPILKSIYPEIGSEAMLTISIMSIPFRIMVYIVSFFMISEIKIDKKNISSSLKKIFLNPIMIAMFSGMIIWLIQNFIPQITVDGQAYGFLRIDKTLPALYTTVLALEKLVGPLAMFLIGITLGENKLSEIFSDKLTWLIALLRTLIVPLIVLLIITFTNSINLTSFSKQVVVALTIGFAAPTSVSINLFCVKYNYEDQFSSKICLLSTLLCIISIPFVYGIANIL